MFPYRNKTKQDNANASSFATWHTSGNAQSNMMCTAFVDAHLRVDDLQELRIPTTPHFHNPPSRVVETNKIAHMAAQYKYDYPCLHDRCDDMY